jgi:hypothetical protein
MRAEAKSAITGAFWYPQRRNRVTMSLDLRSESAPASGQVSAVRSDRGRRAKNSIAGLKASSSSGSTCERRVSAE